MALKQCQTAQISSFTVKWSSNVQLEEQTHNLSGFQDGTGLPDQRSLEGLHCHDLHHSTVAIETVHILTKLQRESIITYRGWNKSKRFNIYVEYYMLESAPYFLEDRGKNSSGITVLGRILAIEPTEFLQARQLQGIHVRRVVLRQMFVSLQLMEGWKTETPQPRCKGHPHVSEFQKTQITYQSCNIMQNLDLRQEEQVSLESKSSSEVTPSGLFFICGTSVKMW